MVIICLKNYNQKPLTLNKKFELRSPKNALLNKKAGSARPNKNRFALQKPCGYTLEIWNPFRVHGVLFLVSPRVRRTAFATRG